MLLASLPLLCVLPLANFNFSCTYRPDFRVDQSKFPAPEFHSFTGTAFTAPNAMHSALWLAVGGGAGVPRDIEKALRKKLTHYRSSPMVVVMVDEIDQLLSHNRQVLRKLFEWADAPKSRLVSDTTCQACARLGQRLKSAQPLPLFSR